MTASIRLVALPARFRVRGRLLGNTIQQLEQPERKESLTVAPYALRRMAGLSLTRADGSSMVVSSRSAAAPPEIPELLHVKNFEALRTGGSDAVDGRWLSPTAKRPDELSRAESQADQERVLDSWRYRFRFQSERREGEAVAEQGLRPPQLGALHGVLAHWATSTAPATVVMPTGTGKTETMLALLVSERLRRLLVVVPSDALREQVGEKFLCLGLLKQLGALDAAALYPTVGLLKRKPRTPEEVDEYFLRCNVVVTTMAVAGQCVPAVQQRMAELCSHAFFDEAHHISARTWLTFRERFFQRPVVQFTATPFRGDGKLVDGRVVFNYPLRKAQEEGYFRPITFVPVDEFDTKSADFAIARRALHQLAADTEAGYSHTVMARCASQERAETVHTLYRELAPEADPVLLHNQVPAAEAQESLRKVRAGEARVVVCVNMLGEGFDLPELKIAALHDPHKGLAITLQFTGRFTRTRADLGNATMVANVGAPDVGDALRALYAEDADWNLLLRELSERTNSRETRRSEFLERFQDLPEGIALRNVFPKMSAVVYRTAAERWHPERTVRALEPAEIHAGPTVNERDKVLLLVTREHEDVPWGAVRQLRNSTWHLYLVHWDEEGGLIFINSSNNNGVHEELARAVAGEDVELIRGEAVFRSLHDIKRLVLTNLGLSDIINYRNRFSLHVGTDISSVLPDALRQHKKKSNLFARGFEKGVPVSIGCSQKGRVWSMTTAPDISSWVDWCRVVGAKLKDASIATEDVLRNVILPVHVTARPDLVPLLIDWPAAFHMRPEDSIKVGIDEESVLLSDAELRIVDFSRDGPIRFRVETPTKSAEYVLRFTDKDVFYEPTGASVVHIAAGRSHKPLAEWFREEPPAIWFDDGSQLEHNELFKLPASTSRRPFDGEKIQAWDWTGVDLKRESQKLEKRADSIQRRVLDHLLGQQGEPRFQVVFDDDDAGEAADIVCLGDTGDRLVIHLYHCKFSGDERPGARVDDLYAVCGQAQRSAHWRRSIPDLLRHLRLREESRKARCEKAGRPHVSRFERGSLRTLRDLERASSLRVVDARIVIVQPGLSKSAADVRQLELLAVTEVYLMETAGVPLDVIASA